MLLGWHYMYYYHNSYAMNQYLASRGYLVLSVNYRSGIGVPLVVNSIELAAGLPAGTTPPADQGLFEMGLDSLLAMDLRARLETLSGCALPATLAVDCPTIAALAALLLTRMAPSAPVPAAPVARADHHLEHLSDSEAEALLLARLGSLSAKG